MATSPKVAAWQALRSLKGIGPVKLTDIAMRVSEQRVTLAQALRDINEPLSREVIVAIDRAAEMAAIDEELPNGVRVVTPEDEVYPHHRLDPRLPLSPVLFVSGNEALLGTPGIAISGSRKSSPEALEFVRRTVEFLSSKGLNIVSGHAAGVDEVAHVTALGTGGTTTVVAAEGLGRFKIRKSLSHADEGSILIVSEFDLNQNWTAFRAMKRNATIAALADVVVVVAAGLTGGSRAQAELCLRAKKAVLVPDVRTPDAEGNQALIRMGAIPLDPSNPETILEYLRRGSGQDGAHPNQLNFLDS